MSSHLNDFGRGKSLEDRIMTEMMISFKRGRAREIESESKGGEDMAASGKILTQAFIY